MNMTDKSLARICCYGILSIWLYPYPLLAQVPTGATRNSPTTYEDDRIKVVIQDCSRKLQDLVCKAILTSKNNDRTVDLNGSTIKLVDFEGNEYYPTSMRLANRTSENNSIKTELIENVPFKASFVFVKMPASITQVALLQIPLSGGVNTMAKFRNFAIVTPNNLSVKPVKTSTPTTNIATVSSDVSNDNDLVCPERTKILYRAISKSYTMYICGVKNPTHYVGLAKDGSQGITLRLRYYDRTQFSADNGETNYTIAADRLIIRKDSKIIYQEKIQVLQPLPGAITAESTTARIKPKKQVLPQNSQPDRLRNSTNQSLPKIQR
jgi:hypothetical protein